MKNLKEITAREMTMEYLKRITAKSERILTKILALQKQGLLNTPEHHALAYESERLNRREIQIRKKMGIFRHDPCPKTNCSCETCSGIYSVGGKEYRCAIKDNMVPQRPIEPRPEDEDRREYWKERSKAKLRQIRNRYTEGF